MTTHFFPNLIHPEQLILFFHGYGDTGDNFATQAPFWQAHFPKAILCFPDGLSLRPIHHSGYRWFSLDDYTPAVLVQEIEKATPAVEAIIRQAQKKYAISPQKTALVGFSQGGMLVLDLVTSYSDLCAAAVCYAGALLRPGTLKTPLLLSHGKNDSVVPVERSQEAYASLKEGPVELTLIPKCDHTLSSQSLQQGVAFLNRYI